VPEIPGGAGSKSVPATAPRAPALRAAADVEGGVLGVAPPHFSGRRAVATSQRLRAVDMAPRVGLEPTTRCLEGGSGDVRQHSRVLTGDQFRRRARGLGVRRCSPMDAGIQRLCSTDAARRELRPARLPGSGVGGLNLGCRAPHPARFSTAARGDRAAVRRRLVGDGKNKWGFQFPSTGVMTTSASAPSIQPALEERESPMAREHGQILQAVRASAHRAQVERAAGRVSAEARDDAPLPRRRNAGLGSDAPGSCGA
jgi:hypothetical protein